jgi:oligoendopeptidase F
MKLPKNAVDALSWEWEKFAPFYAALNNANLTAENVTAWMKSWSEIEKLVSEVYMRIYVDTTLNTKDETAEKKFHKFLEHVFPVSEAASQKLKEKLLASKLEVEGFDIQLRNMRAEANLFREENLPLLAEEQKLGNKYDKIAGEQSIMWEGEETTFPQLLPVYQDINRERREKAWQMTNERWLEDRKSINNLWVEFMELRGTIGNNAGYDNYRDYRWQELLRLDYTPQDCIDFQDAIEKVVVPAAVKIYEKRKKKLGLEKLRPWDLDVAVSDNPPLKPFKSIGELIEIGGSIFQMVDPELGGYFGTMVEENLLDLKNRKGKSPGAYCIDYLYSKRPFVFMNAVGVQEDVRTFFHEIGHAFHVFESINLPYIQQMQYGAEIAEVASMSMELLTAPYLDIEKGGFLTKSETARARIEQFEGMILFWPYMAVVDAFQHWVYDNHEAAKDSNNCDAKWSELWGRFMKGIDVEGLEDWVATGWHRKLHIHQIPFYYVDYGLAQLGAAQVWANALEDQAQSVKNYRAALSLGATKTLPELFDTAGAKFAFDAETLGKSIDLIEKTLEELEATL